MGCKPSKSKIDTNGLVAPLIAGGCVLGEFQSTGVADESAMVARNSIGQSKQTPHIHSSNVTSKKLMIADVKNSLEILSEWKKFLSKLYRCLDDESKNIPSPTAYLVTESLEYSGDRVKEMYKELKELIHGQREDMDTMPQGIRELSKECNAKVKSIETLKSGITFSVGIFQINLVCTGMIALPVVLPIVWAVSKFASESAKMASFFSETKLKETEGMNNKIQEVVDKICSAKLNSVMVALETKLQTLVREIELLPCHTSAISFRHIYGNHGLEGNTDKVKRQVKKVQVVIDKIETHVWDLVAYMWEQI